MWADGTEPGGSQEGCVCVCGSVERGRGWSGHNRGKKQSGDTLHIL